MKNIPKGDHSQIVMGSTGDIIKMHIWHKIRKNSVEWDCNAEKYETNSNVDINSVLYVIQRFSEAEAKPTDQHLDGSEQVAEMLWSPATECTDVHMK